MAGSAFDKTLRIIRERVNCRSGDHGLEFRFLEDFSRVASLVHKALPQTKGRPELSSELKSLYVIRLVAIVETLFRECLLSAARQSIEVQGRIFKAYGDKSRFTAEQVAALGSSQVAICDFCIHNLSFLSLEEIQIGLSPTASSGDFLGEFGRFKIRVGGRFGVTDFQLDESIPDWKSLLSTLLRDRHNCAHNSSATVSIDAKTMAKVEATVLVIVQLLPLYLQPQPLTDPQDSELIPALFVVDDLIAEDWEIVNDSLLDSAPA